ncbi:unnamed protein product [[Actinomadura] parvosata subsp. kistnae]|uniref:helix-turn-helix domain-containing protein n=1 Tax=[Actinomadura] parvosata TaxID=1955412 RepID=UPI000D2798A4|nr:helix-turn-helix domain-containing protein [Nonomuraea sp. ATCC 55076]SPL98285.1 unnamed protein product [Actinomadura parvosata subsp. kistnae]
MTFLTRAEAVAALGITVRHLRRLALTGLCPHRQNDGRWLYRSDEVEARKPEGTT